MTRMLVVRHGATDWNDTKRAQGWADVVLNRKGHRQAIKIAEELAHLDVAAVYSSDLKRAVDTARPIAEAQGLEVATDPDLREIDQGEWTGLSTDEIRTRWPELWGPARHYNRRPGGESPTEVRVRALNAIQRIARDHPDDVVVVVSHGGTIRWISAEALGFDEIRSRLIRGLGNGAAVSLDASLDDGRLVLENLVRLDGNTTDLDDPND